MSVWQSPWNKGKCSSSWNEVKFFNKTHLESFLPGSFAALKRPSSDSGYCYLLWLRKQPWSMRSSTSITCWCTFPPQFSCIHSVFEVFQVRVQLRPFCQIFWRKLKFAFGISWLCPWYASWISRLYLQRAWHHSIQNSFLNWKSILHLILKISAL